MKHQSGLQRKIEDLYSRYGGFLGRRRRAVNSACDTDLFGKHGTAQATRESARKAATEQRSQTSYGVLILDCLEKLPVGVGGCCGLDGDPIIQGRACDNSATRIAPYNPRQFLFTQFAVLPDAVLLLWLAASSVSAETTEVCFTVKAAR